MKAGTETLLNAPTVSAGSPAGTAGTPTALPSAAPRPDVVPPTPGALWLRERGGAIGGFHRAALLRTPRGLRAEHLTQAVGAVLERHEVLRGRLRDDWALAVRPAPEVPAGRVVGRVGVTGLDGAALREAVAARARADAAELDPRAGEMIRVTWFDAGPARPGRLLVSAHRLAVDGGSWRVLLPDLYAAWHRAASGAPVTLDPVPTPAHVWGARLRASAGTAERRAELPYWRRVLEAGDVPLTDARLDPVQDVYATAGSLALTLPPDVSGPLLTSVPAAYGAGVEDVLLTGLALAVSAWRREQQLGSATGVLVGLAADGRRESAGGADPSRVAVPGPSGTPDLSRTVGRLTGTYPVRLDAGLPGWRADRPADPRLGAAVSRIAAQRGAVPGHGLGYGVLRHLTPDSGLAGLPEPQIGFSYAGRAGGPADSGGWRTAPESAVLPRGAGGRMPMPHAVEVRAAAEERPGGPRLTATWSWPGLLLTEDDVRDLAEAWFAALRALAAHAAGAHGGGAAIGPSLPPGELARLEDRFGPLADVLPLTPLQRSLLFDADDHPAAGRGLDPHTVQLTVELAGAPDAVRLRAACESVLTRHAALRAAFVRLPGGEPAQVLPRGVRLPWRTVDFGGLPAGERDAALRALLAADRREPFDPARPPLMRAVLADLGGGRHVLVLTRHRVLADAWTTSLLLRDLFTLYEHDGDDSALPAAAPYRDYLARLAAQDVPAARQAWRAALGGLTGPTLLLPGADTARVRALPERLAAELDENAAEDLRDAVRQQGVTLDTVLCAAWAFVLNGLTGRRDVVFGGTVPVRPADLPGIEEMAGLCLNTLPVRVRLDAAEPLCSLVERLRREQAALTPYRHLAPGEVRRVAGPGTLFDTCVVLETGAAAPLFAPGAVLRPHRVSARAGCHYPLTLTAVPGRAVRVEVGYRPDLLDAGVARRAAERLTALLGAFPAAWYEPVGHFLAGGGADGA